MTAKAKCGNFTTNITEFRNILINSKNVAEAKRKAEAKGWTCRKINYAGYDALDARKGLTVCKVYCNDSQAITVWKNIQMVQLSQSTPKDAVAGVKRSLGTTGRPPRVKTMTVAEGKRWNISEYPNFSVTGSVVGMRKRYGRYALFVRCGSYIYNVQGNPKIYDAAK